MVNSHLSPYYITELPGHSVTLAVPDDAYKRLIVCEHMPLSLVWLFVLSPNCSDADVTDAHLCASWQELPNL
jgi:hypothetical protein